MNEVKIPLYAFEEISACVEVIKQKATKPGFFNRRQSLRDIKKFADMAEMYLSKGQGI